MMYMNGQEKAVKNQRASIHHGLMTSWGFYSPAEVWSADEFKQ